jgi:tetratricopeptide (TPR) repeat protein
MLTILLLTICLLIPLSAHAASLSGNIKEGNRYYKQGDYDKALEKYEAAGEASPDLDIVNLNKGTAYYQKGQYQEAIDAFTKALNTEDNRTEADSIYNIANSKYKLGSANAENDINSAVSLYRESLDYYKRAIELDEGNRDAKYNHELVERELKVLLDKLKNKEQQDDQKKEQDNDKKEEQKSDSKESESNESKEEKKQQDQDARDDQEMKEDKGDQQQTAGEDSGQEQDAGQQEERNDGMSPEEAKMLLEAFGEEEARDAAKKQKGAQYPRVLKDW